MYIVKQATHVRNIQISYAINYKSAEKTRNYIDIA